jgi:hypothetical protein
MTSKFRWAYKDKSKAENLARDIQDLNDGLTPCRISEFRAVDSVAQSELLRSSAGAHSLPYLQEALSG